MLMLRDVTPVYPDGTCALDAVSLEIADLSHNRPAAA